jgi:hypothetical protein
MNKKLINSAIQLIVASAKRIVWICPLIELGVCAPNGLQCVSIIERITGQIAAIMSYSSKSSSAEDVVRVGIVCVTIILHATKINEIRERSE